MTTIDISLIGSEDRETWLTCCPEWNAAGSAEALFDGSTGAVRNQTYLEFPSEADPWWWQIDFQESMSLKTWIVGKNGSYPTPEDCKIYGSATGAFNGEETEVAAFVDLPETSGDGISLFLNIQTPQSFRYFRLVVTAYDSAWQSWIYHKDFSFMFSSGDLTIDTTEDYIDPDCKIGDSNWCYQRRKISSDPETRFLEVACMFVEDLGWDVEALDYPNSMIVKTNGLNSDQPYAYVKVSLYSDHLYFEDRYAYWDSDSRTGVLPLPRHSGTYPYYRESIYWGAAGLSVWGNRDLVIFGSADYKTDGYQKGFFLMGHVPTNQSLKPAHTKLTAGINQAYNATVIVESTAGFEEDEYYQIWGASGEGRDHGIQVTSIIDATHMVVDNMPRDYAAGAFIGTYPQTFFAFSYYLYTFGQRSISGLEEGGGSFGLSSFPTTYGDPSGPQNRHALFPVQWYEGEGTNPGIVGLTSQNILTGAGDYFDIYLIGSKKPKDKGAVDSSTDTSLTDTSADWTTDEHAGRYAYISEGTAYQGIGNFFKISSNTSDTLVIDGNWIINPVADDTFYIADEIWQKAASNSPLVLKCGA